MKPIDRLALLCRRDVLLGLGAGLAVAQVACSSEEGMDPPPEDPPTGGDGAPDAPPFTGATHMKDFSDDQWAKVFLGAAAWDAERPNRVLAMLRSLADVHDGFAFDQLGHALQAATRAYRDNASDELVVCSLCHDMGKLTSNEEHPAIVAAMLEPFVSEASYHVIRTHQEFQGRYYYARIGRDPMAYLAFQSEPWFDLAMQFSTDWDAAAFDPSYPSMRLEDFEPLVRQVFLRPL